MRQDDGDAHGQPDGRDHVRRHPDRRALGPRPLAGRAAARDRLRDPADRAVPAPDDRPEHRHGPGPARLGPPALDGAGDRAARPDRTRARPGRPLSGPALRRPAAARRRRQGAGREPGRDADGRALRRRRPDQPRAASERVPAPAGRAAQDDPVRHPRHRRGDQDGRPDRDPARGRAPGPVRDAGRAADGAGRRLRRGLRRRGPGAQAAVAAAGLGHRPLDGAARPRRPGDRGGARETRRAPRSRTRCWSTPSESHSAGCRRPTSRASWSPRAPTALPSPCSTSTT